MTRFNSSLSELKKAGVKLPPEVVAEIKEAEKLAKEEKQPKYRNRKVTVQGILFDSIHESNQYLTLKDMKAKGEIKDFDRQVEFIVFPGYVYGKIKVKPIKVRVDFLITELDGSKTVWEAKSTPTKTRSYRDKKKLFMNRYPDIKYVER